MMRKARLCVALWQLLATCPSDTLIGDAAQLMAPNGERAELGKAIAAHLGDTDAVIPGYETHKFPHTTAVGAETQELMLTLFV